MNRKVRIRKKMPTAAYAGSLLQNNNGESLEKGYLIWDVERKAHRRRFIPNDYGFVNIIIARGENWEERLSDLKMSANKKKTKVWIRWEDYEENNSQEKTNQIERFIKDKYGCEVVHVVFQEIPKDVVIVEGEEKGQRKLSEELLLEFIRNNKFEVDDALIKEIIDLHRETNELMGLKEEDKVAIEYDIDMIEVSNIFSFPVTPTIIDFTQLYGITGIFGENYNGKSNFIKALVWGLYQEILGGGDSHYILNIYTGVNKGYVKIWLTIAGKKYLIHRSVKTTKKKDGTTSNAYSIEYKKLEYEYDEEGNVESEKWENEESDEKTADQNEVAKLVENAIGIPGDFTKVSLQTQSGKDNYINMQQQPKNQLISRYIGSEDYKIRYDFRKDTFNDIKKRQKELGDTLAIEAKMKEFEDQKLNKQKDYDNINNEKKKATESKEKVDAEILTLTKTLEKVDLVEIKSKVEVEQRIAKCKAEGEVLNTDILAKEEWLSKNFKKELPYEEGVDINALNKELETERANKKTQTDVWQKQDKFLNENTIKSELNITGFEEDITNLQRDILTLENQLITYKGKSCPTCGSVQKKAEPEKIDACQREISVKKEIIRQKQTAIKDNEAIKKFNTEYKDTKVKQEIVMESLRNKKEKIDSLKVKIDLINKSQDIVAHNKTVEKNSADLKALKIKSEILAKDITKFNDNLDKLIKNESKMETNARVQVQIDAHNETSRAYKLSLYNYDNSLKNLFGEIKVLENNIQLCLDRINEVKNAERMFKKYSIYLQAMHKDGIPALIIRKKLPIINQKINSVLSQVVEFKISIDITVNGDLIETFYFSDDKSDALPLAFGSGAVMFISAIAIKEALHYVSTLTKPSMSIIDEGFGTLDNKHIIEIANVLSYLKTRYKNVIVITHCDEIKDYVDNIVETAKVKTGIPLEVLEHNPDAGVTRLSMS